MLKSFNITVTDDNGSLVRDVDDFLSDKNPDQIIDVKYSTTMASHYVYHSVFIIYKTESDNPNSN